MRSLGGVVLQAFREICATRWHERHRRAAACLTSTDATTRPALIASPISVGTSRLGPGIGELLERIHRRETRPDRIQLPLGLKIAARSPV